MKAKMILEFRIQLTFLYFSESWASKIAFSANRTTYVSAKPLINARVMETVAACKSTKILVLVVISEANNTHLVVGFVLGFHL